MKKLTIIVATIVIGLVVVLFGKPPVQKTEAHTDPVKICHATGSAVNPWQSIVVNHNATGGHFDNNGTPLAGHEQDILYQNSLTQCPSDYSVSITETQLSCGTQEITFTGTATYGDNNDHLVVYLDGNQIADFHNEPGNWSTDPQSVGVGWHTLVVKIYDHGTGREHWNKKVEDSWRFEVTECPTQCPDNSTLNEETEKCECNPGYHEAENGVLKTVVTHGLVCEPDPTTTPTPTQEPCRDLGYGCGGSPSFPHDQGPPQCTDGATVNLPANPHVIRSGSDATVNFFITQGDRANIFYKEVGENDWTHSVIGLTGNSDKFVSYTIHDLKAGVGYVFGVQQVQGCGGGQTVTAVIIDGPNSQTFTFSYWEWTK